MTETTLPTLITEARPDLVAEDVNTLAEKINTLIADFLPSGTETVTYVVAEYRAWESSKDAKSGYAPGRYVHDSGLRDDLEEIAEKSGSLYAEVWARDYPATAEGMEQGEAEAKRVLRNWRGARKAFGGHAEAMKRLAPLAPNGQLLGDITPDQLAVAMRREPCRAPSFFHKWTESPDLTAVTRPDTFAAVKAISDAGPDLRYMSGPDAEAFVREAVA